MTRANTKQRNLALITTKHCSPQSTMFSNCLKKKKLYSSRLNEAIYRIDSKQQEDLFGEQLIEWMTLNVNLLAGVCCSMKLECTLQKNDLYMTKSENLFWSNESP